MNKTNTLLFFIAIISLFFAIGFAIEFYRNPKKSIALPHNYTTLYSDTNILIQHITNSYYHSDKQLKPSDSIAVIERDIDSGEIFRIWANKYFFQDSYKDSLLDLHVFDTIYQNRIIGRSLKYTANIPVSIITNTVDKKLALHVGFIGSPVNFGPSAILTHKRLSFQATWLLQNRSLSTFQFGLFRKL